MIEKNVQAHKNIIDEASKETSFQGTIDMLSKQMSSMTNEVVDDSAQEHDSEQSFGGDEQNIEVYHKPMRKSYKAKEKFAIQIANSETQTDAYQFINYACTMFLTELRITINNEI